ncbi:hypothetical protein Cgig2_003882 [Carnegiea gigantea]|uniref:AAA+ ATPase At3g28540-like C-terminal domain-containing protein n=1 Tax=Carnegiea gigantea TaxID=171969 RepID=A0A9Q1Q711_9CARY|nr:hypothetical protein Cgig2_003882 [Carnegiea gigantea]
MEEEDEEPLFCSSGLRTRFMKKSIIDYLDHFVRRKEFYKKAGKACKTGHLLYGPLGTGKSSLDVAMAKYLKFDIYDVQLSCVDDDATLGELMLYTTKKSILVIKDINCCLALPSWWGNVKGCSDDDQESNGSNEHWPATKIREHLDLSLFLCMDTHMHMSFLTTPGFRILTSIYLLDISSDEHPHLFVEIERLLESVNLTTAQVAQEILRTEDPKTALLEVIKLPKQKISKGTKMKKMDVLSEKSIVDELGRIEKIVKD